MIRATLKLLTLLALAPFLLSGCSALSALDQASEPLEIYELRTPDMQQPGRIRSVELVVEEPVASGALATERIMIKPAPLQAQYLPGVRWADTAPVMLQTLLVRTILETGALDSAGRRPVGPAADYAFLSELSDFQAETLEDGTIEIKTRLIVRLVRERDARVVATRTFSANEMAVSNDPEAIIAAFDRATSRLISDSISWVFARLN